MRRYAPVRTSTVSFQSEADSYLARYFTGEAASAQSDEAVRVLRLTIIRERPLFRLRSSFENSRVNEHGTPSDDGVCQHARPGHLPVSDQHICRRSPVLKRYRCLRPRPHRNQPIRSLAFQMKVPDSQKEYRRRKRPKYRANQQNRSRDFHFA